MGAIASSVMKTALISGSTGLIGHQLLQLLLASNCYEKVIAITRSNLGISHNKLQEVKIDYQHIDNHVQSLKADDVFCCLGTTIAKAGSKAKFQEVDFMYPLALAKLTYALGAKQFLIVSALGADKESAIFYNRVKGELEEAVTKYDFRAIHIFRPSLLLGPRTEKRPGEEAAKLFYKVFWFLLPDKYKAIHSGKVAKAMLYYAKKEQLGTFIHESREMQHF